MNSQCSREGKETLMVSGVAAQQGGEGGVNGVGDWCEEE